jgi:hypothetical protein
MSRDVYQVVIDFGAEIRLRPPEARSRRIDELLKMIREREATLAQEKGRPR